MEVKRRYVPESSLPAYCSEYCCRPAPLHRLTQVVRIFKYMRGFHVPERLVCIWQPNFVCVPAFMYMDTLQMKPYDQLSVHMSVRFVTLKRVAGALQLLHPSNSSASDMCADYKRSTVTSFVQKAELQPEDFEPCEHTRTRASLKQVHAA